MLPTLLLSYNNNDSEQQKQSPLDNIAPALVESKNKKQTKTFIAFIALFGFEKHGEMLSGEFPFGLPRRIIWKLKFENERKGEAVFLVWI